jgi:hypothetical protein
MWIPRWNAALRFNFEFQIIQIWNKYTALYHDIYIKWLVQSEKLLISNLETAGGPQVTLANSLQPKILEFFLHELTNWIAQINQFFGYSQTNTSNWLKNWLY